MNFSVGSIVAGIVFGIFGAFFIKIGRREMHMPTFGLGIALCAFPYFVENLILVWVIGIVLVVLTYKIRG